MTAIEIALITGAAGGIANVVASTLAHNSGNMLKIFSGSFKEIKDKVLPAARKYAENYHERHGQIKVLKFMRKSVSLESIYTKVQLLDEDGRSNFRSLHEMELGFWESNRQFQFLQDQKKKRSGVKIANQEQYLMVLGAPGAGKSTFLRKMGLEALKGKQGRFNYGLIPVFVELKRFTESKIDIQQYLTAEFTTCGFPQPKETVNQLLEQGKLLILLDGLDEIPTRNLNPAIDKIQDFVDQYKENRFIASSRTAAYHSSFRRFTDVTIANFEETQIEQFIQNWFQSEEDKRANTATKCWQALNQAENQGARELAQTPLLLTFLCLVYNQSQNVPNKRSSLYGKALRILLEEWGAEKRVERDPIYQQLSTELEEVLLGKIAFAGFEQDRLFFQKQEIVQQIKSFLTSNLNAPQHLDGEKVLQAIELQQGILVERAADIFSFSHLTFQEYLVAQHLVDNNKIPELVSNYATNTRWQEVFLLVAELMRGGADDLLWLMEQQARQYLTTPVGQKYLVPLLDWSEKMTAGSKSKLTPGKKRAIANAYVIAYAYANAYAITNAYAYVIANAYANAYAITNAITNAYANAYAITNAIANAYAIANANAYANALEKFIDVACELDKLEIYNQVNYNVLIARLEVLKARIPDDQQPRKVQRKFSQKIIQTWLEAFQLNLELVTIPQAELEEIDQQYFYVHWLLVKCKEAAMFVSPQTWQQLEEKMLTADELTGKMPVPRQTQMF